MANTVDVPRWNLQDLLAGSGDDPVEHLISRLNAIVSGLEAVRPSLVADIAPAVFLDVLKRYEEMAHISGRLRAYAFLRYAVDTQNSAALTLRGRVDQVLTEAHNRTLFFGLWFKDLPDDVAATLIAQSGDRHYYLESLRRFKPFTLNEAEEKLINLKDVNGIDALVKVAEMITTRFVFHLEIDGATKTLTRDQLSTYAQHSSPDLRAASYRELWRVFGENATVLSQIYTHRARDWRAEAVDVRGYAEPISYRNLANNLPDAVVDTLLSVCRQNAGVFQRYFRLKARRLGMDRLRRYDIYAPFAASDKTYSYDQAIDMVLASLTDFSAPLAEHVRAVLATQHLDAEPRLGKRNGAFCYGVLPGMPPWVLVNYTGHARDVATLAHELGHAIHASLAGGHSVLTFSPSLPLAETASVFSEMLLTEKLLREETDPSVRRDILAHALDDTYVTVMRQAYFTMFEREAHRAIADGRSFEELCALYQENLKEQFGDAVDVSDDFKIEWVAIPHIYNTPFYTYAYSFGQLLVLALYQQYRAEGTAFIARYEKILSAGGSDAPAAILGQAGLDIASPAFWQGGFDIIEGMINELEALG
jgi:oligoendopeptidase F